MNTSPRNSRRPSVFRTLGALALLACSAGSTSAQVEERVAARLDAAREAMVEDFVRSRGVESPNVLSAMRSIPRHLFVPESFRDRAYSGDALGVSNQYSVPEPYAVARMTELLALRGSEKVLEIGTGSGYHTAVLAKLGGEVFSMEIVPERAEQARELLDSLGYGNVDVRVGNGYEGLPEEGPFDAIVLTAAPPELPTALIDQLLPGGRMVVPVGGFLQELLLIEKRRDGSIRRRRVDVVRMRPMVDVTDERPQSPVPP